jgi:hypothetical protein
METPVEGGLRAPPGNASFTLGCGSLSGALRPGVAVSDIPMRRAFDTAESSLGTGINPAIEAWPAYRRVHRGHAIRVSAEPKHARPPSVPANEDQLPSIVPKLVGRQPKRAVNPSMVTQAWDMSLRTAPEPTTFGIDTPGQS